MMLLIFQEKEGNEMKIKRILGVITVITLSLILFGCSEPTPVINEIIISPGADTYTDAVDLEITYGDSSATLYFTTDGSTADTSSFVYIPGTTTISIYDNASVNVAAYKDGLRIATKSATYVMDRQDVLRHTVTGNYSNTTGSNPVFTIDASTLSSELNFDSSNIDCVYDAYDRSVDINLNNLNVYADGHNYYLQDVVVEEYVDGNWIEYVEFSTNQELLSKIAISLILDCSNSLGSNFSNVLQYAKEFVNIVKTNSPDALISIVDFATDVNSQSLVADRYLVESYINGLSQGMYTAFYDAIQRGLNTVNGSVYPSNSQIYVTSANPTLRWQEMTDSYGYHIQVSSTNSFWDTSYADDDTLDASTLEYTLETDLTVGNTYYWRVRKKNSYSGWDGWSNTYQFTVVDVEGSAIVSFTDGTDNFSTLPHTELIENISETSTKSFTIGLEGRGGVNKDILERLSVNGNYALSDSVSELQTIFETFSQAVSNVYKVGYSRNSQVITTPRPIRFTFVSTLAADGLIGPEGVVTTGTGSLIENFESGTFPSDWSGSWLISTDTNTGRYSLKSLSIGAYQESSFEFTVDVPEDTNITFFRKVSSEEFGDCLRFYIDGNVPSNALWSGDVPWGQVKFPISAGTHRLKWTYSKDISYSYGSDCAWVDDILLE